MVFAPLKTVDETELLTKYSKFILKEFHIFCSRFRISYSTHPLRDDLLLEAQIAFLEACRMLEIQSLDLTASEYAFSKRHIANRLKDCFWYAHNMGKSHSRRIEAGRNLVFSDFSESGGIENLADTVCIDEGRVDLERFLNSLPEKYRIMVGCLLAGYKVPAIAEKMNRSDRAVLEWKKQLGELVLNYLSVA